MHAPRKHTVVIVTGDSIARVDLSREKSLRVKQVRCAQRGINAQLPQAVTDALSLGQRGCGQLWVLAEDFWSGHVSLSSEIVRALDKTQLEQAIALEAEFDSGISPFESRLSYVDAAPLAEGKCTWWVTQAESKQLDPLTAVATTWSGKLRGVATPQIQPAAGTDAERALPSPLLPAEFGSLHLMPAVEVGNLAQSWLSNLLTTPAAVPVVRPQAIGLSQRQQWRLGAAAACAILAVCGADYGFNKERLTQLNVQLADTGQQTASLKKRLNDYEAQGRQLDAETQQHTTRLAAEQRQHLDARRRSDEWHAMREHPVAILQALAETAQASHWLIDIELSAEHAVLRGLAVDSRAVADLAQHLEPEIASNNWRVLPSEVVTLKTSPLVSFNLKLVPSERAAGFQLAGGGNERWPLSI